MSTSLSGLQIGSTFAGVLKTNDNLALSNVLRTVTDGTGADSALSLSTIAGKLTGAFEVTGVFTATGSVAGNVTGNLTGNVTGAASSITGIAAIANGGSGAATSILARNALNKGETVLADGATIATDASTGNVFTVTLGGNRTLGAPSNMAAGATYIWRVTQDGTGSRTLAFASAFKWPAGVAPTLTTAASAKDIVMGVSDGTNVACTALLDVR